MNSKHDQNARPTIILASKANGTDIIAIQASPVTHRLVTAVPGGDNGNNGGNAIIDENGVASWIALSSANNGAIIEVYGDPLTKALLMQ